MRITESKKVIRAALTPTSYEEWQDYGQAPFSLTEICRRTGKRKDSVHKTLKNMLKHGLVTAERVVKDRECNLSRRGFRDSETTGYWRTETIEEDRIAVKQFEKESKARQEAAMEKFLRMMQ